jgi:hypothetical protein
MAQSVNAHERAQGANRSALLIPALRIPRSCNATMALDGNLRLTSHEQYPIESRC